MDITVEKLSVVSVGRRPASIAEFAPTAVRFVGLALVYYVTARLSLELSLVGSSVTPFWPPTGIAVVAFLVFGPAYWPAVALGAFAVNAPVSGPLWAAALIAAGNTLAPLAAFRLLRAVGFGDAIRTLRDALFVLMAALSSTLISATIGTSALLASGAFAGRSWLPAWSVWWTGDAMGILIVAPFLLTVRSMREIHFPWPRTAEVAAEFALLVGGAALIFVTARPVWVLVFPLLALIAWRLHLPGAAPAAFIVSTAAILAAVRNAGPFGGPDLLGRMLGLHSFNAAVAFTSLFLAAVVAERSRVRDALERAAIDLEQVVDRRTAIVETFQRSMLPQSLPDIADVELAARYLPASAEVEIGGDWYDAMSLPTGRIGIAIGDVVGHGTQAAATMGQLRMATRAYAQDGRSPCDVLEQLNGVAHNMDAMATVLYVTIDPDSGEFTFASGGHPPPLVVSGAESHLIGGGLAAPIGSAPYMLYREESGTLAPAVSLLLYTDGLVERRDRHIDERLAELLEAAREAPADLENACDYIVRRMAGTREDDVALVGIRRRALDEARLHLRRPAEPTEVGEVRRVMRRWMKNNDVAAEVVSDVLLAVCEACTNVVQHAYGAAGGAIDIDAVIHDHVLSVSIRDEGAWRRRGTTPELAGGRGVHVMRSVMDEVDVVAGSGGTQIRMRRNLQTAEQR